MVGQSMHVAAEQVQRVGCKLKGWLGPLAEQGDAMFEWPYRSLL